MILKQKSSLAVVELYSGAGGFSLGAARAGFSLIGAVDNDTHAVRAHMTNFPSCKHWQVDLSTVNGEALASRFAFARSELTGIIGGPPCQGFSYIGANDSGDVRNSLFVDFFRIVKDCMPIFFLAENVPGILHKKHENIRKAAFAHVENEYIILPPMKFKASDYGAPTKRSRIFFFGYRPGSMKELKTSDFKPSAQVQLINVRAALKGLPRKIERDKNVTNNGWRRIGKSTNGSFGCHLAGRIPNGVGDPVSIGLLHNKMMVSGCLGTKHSPEVAARYACVAPGKADSVSKSRRLDGNGLCPTLRAGTSRERGSYQAVRPLHYLENRVITPREAARLQGFPDWFQFDHTIWHSFRQIGNSVSPILAESILSVIKNALIEKR